MTEKEKNTSEKIITLLAEHIGTDEEEINSTDTLQDKINMSPTDLADFIEKLKTAGFDTSELDLTNLKSVGDLIEGIISQEDLN
jgi:acyl carrier protein